MALLLSCDGCPATPSSAPPVALSHDAGTDGDELEVITDDDYEILPIGYRMYLPDGMRDFTNRYSFAVMVTASVGPGETFMCSGALIHPRLVVTAGHCVCGEHEATSQGNEVRSVIDGSRCAESATIETVTYTAKRSSSQLLWDEHARSTHGKVRPHPALKLLLNERGAPISSKADLAVIVLDDPISGTSPAVRLPTSEIKPGESFTIVGHGLDGRSDLIFGLRRFGKKKALRLATSNSEGFLLDQDGAAFSSGSGDSCLRQERGGTTLVGITTMVSEEGFALTSTYPHRDWLLSEIRRATTEQSHSSGPKGSTP